MNERKIEKKVSERKNSCMQMHNTKQNERKECFSIEYPFELAILSLVCSNFLLLAWVEMCKGEEVEEKCFSARIRIFSERLHEFYTHTQTLTRTHAHIHIHKYTNTQIHVHRQNTCRHTYILHVHVHTKIRTHLHLHLHTTYTPHNIHIIIQHLQVLTHRNQNDKNDTSYSHTQTHTHTLHTQHNTTHKRTHIHK